MFKYMHTHMYMHMFMYECASVCMYMHACSGYVFARKQRTLLWHSKQVQDAGSSCACLHMHSHVSAVLSTLCSVHMHAS
jgi:hypothetical protein